MNRTDRAGITLCLAVAGFMFGYFILGNAIKASHTSHAQVERCK